MHSTSLGPLHLSLFLAVSTLLGCSSSSSGETDDGAHTQGDANVGGDTNARPEAGADGAPANIVALVDNDGYVGDGSATDSTLLAAYQGYLTAAGIPAFDTISIAADGSQSWNPSAVPSSAQLAKYATVVWFTTDNSNCNCGGKDAPMSTDQEAALDTWLGTGGKTLVVFSENLVSQNAPTTSTCTWSAAPTDPLFAKYLMLQGGDDTPVFYNGSDYTPLATMSFPVAGASAVSAGFASMQWTVGTASPLMAMKPPIAADVVNPPSSGVDVLATVQGNIDCMGTTNATLAIAVGKKNAGGTTSTVVYVGFEPYNIQNGATQAFIDGILGTYTGLP